MISWDFKAVEQKIEHSLLRQRNVQLNILREDLNHPTISGNKLRKLKYNIEAFRNSNAKKIVTYGGAHSNHIAATAFACKELQIPCVGIIRGTPNFDSPTLENATKWGMALEYLNREDYRLQSKTGGEVDDAFIIPEGANNTLGRNGNEEIIHDQVTDFDYCFVAVGTGNTLTGIANSITQSQKAIGINVLKGAEGIAKEVQSNLNQGNWEILNDFHFGGYAKNHHDLNQFIIWFKRTYHVQLDPIYTGKMMMAIWRLVETGGLKNSRILAIHTGGLQGITAYEKRYGVKIT